MCSAPDRSLLFLYNGCLCSLVPEMEITVKPLGLPAKNIKVSEQTAISELLPRVAAEYAVDCESIALLFKGTPLSDKTRTLQEFSIKHGDRVTVVVKPRHQIPVDFETVLNSYLLKSYEPSVAQAIATKFMQLLIKKLDALSLDDIDRFAVVFSQQSS